MRGLNPPLNSGYARSLRIDRRGSVQARSLVQGVDLHRVFSPLIPGSRHVVRLDRRLRRTVVTLLYVAPRLLLTFALFFSAESVCRAALT